MATAADVRRVNKLRQLLYEFSMRGSSTVELDEALRKLYRGGRAPKAKG
jgi:hypothetical protein